MSYKRERRRDEVVGLIAVDAITANSGTRGALRPPVSGKLAEWRALLIRQTQHGRELLRRILNGPIRFIPDGKIYRFHGKAALDRLLSGAVSNLYGVPDGIAPNSTSRTIDAKIQSQSLGTGCRLQLR
jgi:hypothetical protein